MEKETQSSRNYDNHNQETSIGNSSYQNDGSSNQSRSGSNQGSKSSQSSSATQHGNTQRKNSQQFGDANHDGEPLSNLAFDWITFVQKKAKAVKAYDQYIQDARQCNASECAEFFQKAQKVDREHLTEARKHLAQVLQGRMGNQ